LPILKETDINKYIRLITPIYGEHSTHTSPPWHGSGL
jgi:hypothetical protein